MSISTKTRQTEVTRELVDQWERTRPELKALNDATLDKPRGFALPSSEALQLCGGDVKAFRRVYRYWVESVKWLAGITIEYEHASKSYRFIEVERHLTTRHERTLRRIEKTHRQEWQRLAVIRDADMSDHQKRLRLLSMDQHTRAAGAIEASREHHRIATTQPETLPKLVRD